MTRKKTSRTGHPGVYEELRRQIITMEIKPGTDLDENTLVKRFGVSRTPIREALIRLAADGLVENRRNRSATVSILDLDMLRSIFEASDLLERAFTRLACLRRTREDIVKLTSAMNEFDEAMAAMDVYAMVDTNTSLHLGIAEASKNKYFVDSYRRILADHERIAQVWYSNNIENKKETINRKISRQHHSLIAAIKKQDMSKAEEITVAHATLCKDGIYHLLSSGSDHLADIDIAIEHDK